MNETGHMVVARIAWDNLTPAARAQVETLTHDPNNPASHVPTSAQNCDKFTAATYMDDIKPTFSSLHFQNRKMDADCNPIDTPPEAPNAVTFIEKNIAILHDPKASMDEKAEALRYTMHLAGDLHQPLHVADRVTPEHPQGDRGGNLFPLQFMLNQRPTSLHTYWDCAGGEFVRIERPLNQAGTKVLDELVNRIEHQYPQQNFEVRAHDVNPEDWAKDQVNLVKDCYQGIEPHGVPSATYAQKTTDDMNQDAALAGYRLATILNDAFK